MILPGKGIRCARISVNGRLVQVSDDEIDRHPGMKYWYNDDKGGMGHNFYDFRF